MTSVTKMEHTTQKPYTFDRVVRILIGITILVAAFLLIRRLSGVLLPFVIGWLLAYLLNPMVDFLQYKLKFKNRILALSTTLLLFFLIVAGLIWLLVPLLAAEINRGSLLIQTYLNDVSMNKFIPIEWQDKIKVFIAQFDLKTFVESGQLQSVLKNILPRFGFVLNSSYNIILGIVGGFFSLIYLIFILLDFNKISQGLFNIVPPKYRSIAGEILEDVRMITNRYFRGQALIALGVAVIMSVGFLIIQLPLAIVMGIFVGVLNLVPYMQALSIPPVVILALLRAAETGQSAWGLLFGVLIVYLVSQLIQDLILTPKIMGKATGLNPAIVLLSLSVWGSLMGIIGMIIALPLTTLIISYYKRFLTKTHPQPVIESEFVAAETSGIENVEEKEENENTD